MKQLDLGIATARRVERKEEEKLSDSGKRTGRDSEKGRTEDYINN